MNSQLVLLNAEGQQSQQEPSDWGWDSELREWVHWGFPGSATLRATYWLIFFLHPAVLFVGIQLSRQPDGFQTFHKGGGKHFHEHVGAGSQQTLQRWPDRETLWTC